MKARAGLAVLILVCLLVASAPTQVQAYNALEIPQAETPPQIIRLWFYPTPDDTGIAADGIAWRSMSPNGTWAEIHDGDGTSASDGGLGSVSLTSSGLKENAWRGLHRAILHFDTTALPPGSQILQASVWISITNKGDGLNCQPSLALVQSFDPEPGSIVAADYNNLGATPVAPVKTYDEIQAYYAWNIFTIDPAYYSIIVPGGVTKLGLREYKYDCLNVEPPWSEMGQDKGSGFTYNNVEAVYFQYKPYLEIIFGAVNMPPVADADGPYVGEVGFPITLNAAHSTDPNGDPLRYRWDFDNNGTWDTDWLTSSNIVHTWSYPYTGNVVVEAWDGEFTDTATTVVEIPQAETPPQIIRFYPTLGGTGIAADGAAQRTKVFETFAQIHDGDGTSASDSGGESSVSLTSSGFTVHAWRSLQRGILHFDTTALPPGSQILQAKVGIRITGKGDRLNCQSSLALVQSFDPEPSSIVAADYNNLGATPVAPVKTYDEIQASYAWNEFIINEAYDSIIVPGGVTKLGLREYKYDCLNADPPWSEWGQDRGSSFYFNTADAGIQYSPYLEITFQPPWSFAVITDLHIGWGIPDYDGQGYADSTAGQDYYLTTRLQEAVDWLNQNYDNPDYNIKFVVVTGDISDTAEKSEFLTIRGILNGLEIPYVPLIGNHDIWPYVAKPNKSPDDREHHVASGAEEGQPLGDEYFEEVFWENNPENLQKIDSLFGENGLVRQEEQIVGGQAIYEGPPYLQNYAFSYGGMNFIALDFSPRVWEQVPAVINSLRDETRDWFEGELGKHEGERVIVFHHQPFIREYGIPFAHVFESGPLSTIGNIIVNSGCQIFNIAGHLHRNLIQTPGNRYTVVETQALLQSPGKSIPGTFATGEFIRIVQVNGPNFDDINYDTLIDGFPPAINPYFYINRGEVGAGEEITFTAISRNNVDIDRYYWDFGDGTYASVLDPKYKKIYQAAGDYIVSLTVTDEDNNSETISWTLTVKEQVPTAHKVNLEVVGLKPVLGQEVDRDLTEPDNAQNTAEWVVILKTASPGKPVGGFITHFEQATQDIDLSNIHADTDLNTKKSILYMQAWPSEVEESKELYIPYSEDGTVYICPQATSLAEVNPHAPGTVFLEPGETADGMTAFLTLYEGELYYVVRGFVSGGGGMLLPNQPPELAPVGNKTVGEGQLLSFTILATDPDGDPLTYSASNLPLGASFDPVTRTFSWTPGYDQAGTYTNVHFEVTDGTASVFEEITIRVNNCVDLFMRGAAPDLILDITPPSSTSAKYKDSPGVKRTTFMEIGTWNAVPMTETQNLTSLGNLTVWVGLKNSDDQGTYFDIRAEVLKNGAVIASTEVKDIQGVTRNPDKAKEVVVSFGTIPNTTFEVGDIFSVRVLTKVADTGGHSNAVGLRLYYDSVSRPSWVNTMFYR